MVPKFSFSPLSASSPPEMKQTQKIKTPIPHGSHVDCSASLTKLTALQGPIAILSVCVYGRPGFYWWGKNDIGAGTDTDFIGACTGSYRRHQNLVLVSLLLGLHPVLPEVTTLNANGRIRLHRLKGVHYHLGQTLQSQPYRLLMGQ